MRNLYAVPYGNAERARHEERDHRADEDYRERQRIEREKREVEQLLADLDRRLRALDLRLSLIERHGGET